MANSGCPLRVTYSEHKRKFNLITSIGIMQRIDDREVNKKSAIKMAEETEFL